MRIAFIELKKSTGETLYLEDFPYAHVAIFQEGTWWHAHWSKGVEAVSLPRLQQIGSVQEIIEVDVEPTLSLKPFKGMGYDPYFSWDNERFYCSELVGKTLGIEPAPMHFDLKYWPEFYQKFEGLPGLSPSAIYEHVQTLNGVVRSIPFGRN